MLTLYEIYALKTDKSDFGRGKEEEKNLIGSRS